VGVGAKANSVEQLVGDAMGNGAQMGKHELEGVVGARVEVGVVMFALGDGPTVGRGGCSVDTWGMAPLALLTLRTFGRALARVSILVDMMSNGQKEALPRQQALLTRQ
jgi:hypothetical protein